ncbi:MAG: nucleotidyltransferase family protein [Pseudomonadota bacterium]
MVHDYSAALVRILRADPVIWPALTAAEALDLPDWWIVSGAVYNTVWNALTGRPPGYGIKDIDLFYFDAEDLSYAAEDRVIRRAEGRFAPKPPVEIRNQARVHLWYAEHFGYATAQCRSSADSIERFASRTHAVGVRPAAGGIEILAPYGLDAIFEMRLVPNPLSPNRATHEAKAERAKALWPELSVEPWPEQA